MSKLFLEELAPDMVLEKPIKDQFGLILFQKGVILSEKTINTLKMWGVSEVSIEDSSIEEHAHDAPQVDPVVTAQAEENVELLFRHNQNRGTFVKELMRHITFRKVKQRMKELANAQ